MHFNVSFMTNARPSVAMDIATGALNRALMMNQPKSASRRSLAHRWLFPDPSDLGSEVLPPLPPPNDGTWEDIGLNPEQKVWLIKLFLSD